MNDFMSEIYFNFKNSIDLSKQTRQDWQRIAYGENRVAAQALLIKLSEIAANSGTSLDSVEMLKAAHAVLPLRNIWLNKLVMGLLNEHPFPFEWTDALMSYLMHHNTDNQNLRLILNAIKEAIYSLYNNNNNELSLCDRTKIKIIINNLRRMNYSGLIWLQDAEIKLVGNNKDFYLKMIAGSIQYIGDKKKSEIILSTELNNIDCETGDSYSENEM